MSVKIELLGVTASNNYDSINVFFKTPKRYIYQLMFVRQNEYLSIPHDIDLNKNKNFRIIEVTPFYYSYERKTDKYNIRLFQHNANFFQYNSFDEFVKLYVGDDQKKLELYEFLFSDIFKHLMKEENVNYRSICSNRTKQLYKYLKKCGV